MESQKIKGLFSGFNEGAMKSYDLENVGREIIRNKDFPWKLDDILLDLTGWMMYFSEQFIQLEQKEAQFHKEYKGMDNPLSDKSIESLWKVTPEGADHIRVKQTLKAIEKAMSNVKSSIRLATEEARGIV